LRVQRGLDIPLPLMNIPVPQHIGTNILVLAGRTIDKAENQE
jgi:hypothetical protein